MKYINQVGMPNDKLALFNIMAFRRWANWINTFDIGETMNKLKNIMYIIQNIGVFFVVLGIFPIMPDKLTDIGIAIGGFALLMRCIKFREQPEFFKIKSWWPLIGMLGYIIVLMGVSQYSLDVHQSSHVVYNYFKYMKAAFYVFLLMNNDSFFVRAVFYGLAIGACGICLGPDNMIFQHLHSQNYYQYDMHRNMVADIFILIIPCAILYLVKFSNYLIEQALWGVFLGLYCLTLYCSESRGAVLALLFTGIFFSFWYCVYRDIDKKKLLIGIVTVLGVVIGGLITIPNNNHLSDIEKAVQITSTPIEEYSEKGRVYLYQGTLNMIKDYPLTGVGLDNFNKVYVDNYMVKGAIEKNLPHAHNFILAIISTTGIIGFFGFLFMEWQFIYFFFERRWNLTAFIGMFCLIVLLVHDLVDYSLSVYLICKMYWIILIACSCIISIEGSVK